MEKEYKVMGKMKEIKKNSITYRLQWLWVEKRRTNVYVT